MNELWHQIQQNIQGGWIEQTNMIVSLVYRIVGTLLILTLSFYLARLIQNSVQRFKERHEKMDATLVPLLQSTATLSIYGVATVIILDMFGVNTTSIIALMGAAGLAIGLALKQTLSNIAAGIMLIILRPFRMGDFIECDSIKGTVKQLGLFTTIIETPDGVYISAPNEALWGKPITNYNRNPKRRMSLIVGISYGDSIDTAFQVFQNLIDSDPRILQDPEPKMMVQEMADSAVNLQLRLWTTVEDYWDVHWESQKKLKEEIEKAGLTIPFPQRDVYVKPV